MGLSGRSDIVKKWISDGMLPALPGVNVWDIGCGWGEFSGEFIEHGANRVIATDVVVDRQRISKKLIQNPRITFIEGAMESVSRRVFLGHFGVIPDICFMHLMTEHVSDLRDFFSHLYSNMPSGCSLFVHHDNYYQPVGHHDHAILDVRSEILAGDPSVHSLLGVGWVLWRLGSVAE